MQALLAGLQTGLYLFPEGLLMKLFPVGGPRPMTLGAGFCHPKAPALLTKEDNETEEGCDIQITLLYIQQEAS